MSETKGLNVIVWSKDRPAQLHLCLETLISNFKEAKDSTIAVVYRATTARMTKAYDQLRSVWSANELEGGPKINFIYDTNFYLMTVMAFGYHEQTMFVVDDQVFTDTFSTSDEAFVMQRNGKDKFFTISLRLDPTKNYCYPVDQNQPIPEFTLKTENTLAWNWSSAKFDWGYVASLDGNVYITDPIRGLISQIQPNQITNPNTLENILNAVSQQGAVTYPKQNLAYAKAKTVSIPVNKVQSTFNNRSSDSYSIEELLNKWEEGYKIDADAVVSKVKDSNSPHTPVEYTFIKR